ncbi:MAG: LysR family transcriptional regulator [Chloroflexota bacterium]|nr:LysR family transcriptional regulator [Chloroflexota bacterium]
MRRIARTKRDRLRQLRAFCEAARRGSISRAAEHLELTHAAVSSSVRALEHELGDPLFVRTTAGVAPTPEGERLYALADPLVRDAESLLGDFARHLDLAPPEGVRIASSNAGAAFVLPAYVRRFRDAHPAIAVRMETAAVREGLRRLAREEVDLVTGPRESFDEETVAYRELRTYRVVLICATGHPLAGRASVSPREAAAFPAVVPPEGTYSRQFGQTAAEALGIAIDAVMEVGGWGVLKRYVGAGFGISVVPSLVLSPSDRLSVVALEWDEPPRSFGVYARRDRHLTPAARRFLEVLLPNVSAPPPADSGTPPPAVSPAG